MVNLKPSREQSGLYNLFSRYVKDDGTIIHAEFAEDIKDLRRHGDSISVIQPLGAAVDDPSPFLQFTQKYRFPPTMHMFLLDFITRYEINPDKLSFGVYIVDEGKGEASGRYDASLNYIGYSGDSIATKYVKLTLAIPVDATNLQIREAIKEAKGFIKSRQTEANGGSVPRKRFSVNAELNNWVLDQYNQGLKPKQILLKLPKKFQSTMHTAQDISDIINRHKNK
jgi:hypothetical protein